MFKSISNTLDENKKFDYVKDKSVGRYLSYFKECSYIRINHVYLSNEFKHDLLNPRNKKFLPAYHAIINDLYMGKGIRNYLSSSILRFTPDGIYADWGIIHLHFDKKVGSKYRSNHMLLIRIFNMNVYVLKIITHRGDSFHNKNYLHIIYRNWPDTLNISQEVDASKAKFINQRGRNLSKFRKLGVNQTYTIHEDNKCITILGNGYNGDKSLTVRDWQHIREMSYSLFGIFRNCSQYLYDKNMLSSGWFVYDVDDGLFKFYTNNIFPTDRDHFVFQFESKYILNMLHDGYYANNHTTPIMINPEYSHK